MKNKDSAESESRMRMERYGEKIGTEEGKMRLLRIVSSAINIDDLKMKLEEYIVEEIPIIKQAIPLLKCTKKSMAEIYESLTLHLIDLMVEDIRANCHGNPEKYQEILNLTYKFVTVKPINIVPLTIAAELPEYCDLNPLFEYLHDVNIYEQCNTKLKRRFVYSSDDIFWRKIKLLVDDYLSNPKLKTLSKEVIASLGQYKHADEFVNTRMNCEEFLKIKAIIGNSIQAYKCVIKHIKERFSACINPLLSSLMIDLIHTYSRKHDPEAKEEPFYYFVQDLFKLFDSNNADLEVESLYNNFVEMQALNLENFYEDLGMILRDPWVLVHLSWYVYNSLYNSLIINQNYLIPITFFINLIEHGCHTKKIIRCKLNEFITFPYEQFEPLSDLFAHLRVETEKRHQPDFTEFKELKDGKNIVDIFRPLKEFVLKFGSVTLLLSHYYFNKLYISDNYGLGEVNIKILKPCMEVLDYDQREVELRLLQPQSVIESEYFTSVAQYYDPFDDLIHSSCSFYLNVPDLSQVIIVANRTFYTFYLKLYVLSTFNLFCHKEILSLVTGFIDKYFAIKVQARPLTEPEIEVLKLFYDCVLRLAGMSKDKFIPATYIVMRPYYKNFVISCNALGSIPNLEFSDSNILYLAGLQDL